uniref:Uncharacterized protein n=1 Tax=Chrysotila carterae TaxID=13221 RepID=A0A7S4EVE0_CHRCT
MGAIDACRSANTQWQIGLCETRVLPYSTGIRRREASCASDACVRAQCVHACSMRSCVRNVYVRNRCMRTCGVRAFRVRCKLPKRRIYARAMHAHERDVSAGAMHARVGGTCMQM